LVGGNSPWRAPGMREPLPVRYSSDGRDAQADTVSKQQYRRGPAGQHSTAPIPAITSLRFRLLSVLHSWEIMKNGERPVACRSLRLEGVLPVICGTRRKCRKRVKDERGRGGDAKQLPYGATQPGSFRTTQRAVQEAIILGMGWV
jgi:hypothetical protein